MCLGVLIIEHYISLEVIEAALYTSVVKVIANLF
jgi:hypothetical protein